MLAPLAYEYEWDDYYCYPDSVVLKNKLNIEDAAQLDAAEREITTLRMAKLIQTPLKGELDFDYLLKIHKYLFDGIYEWAGELRKIDISKGNIFCQHELVTVNAEALMNELKCEKYLVGMGQEMMSKRLAYYLGDLNSIHSFREGNGRVQRMFILELARRAGYILDFDTITAEEMIIASDCAFRREYEPMERLIAKVIRKRL